MFEVGGHPGQRVELFARHFRFGQPQVALQKAELAQARAALAHDEAVRSQAGLNLGYTAIVAPADGVVGNRTLRVGQFVQAGTQLMSVVPSAEAYVVANFKETQLTDVRRGQPVDIEVDVFPRRVYLDSRAGTIGRKCGLALLSQLGSRAHRAQT